MGLILLLWHLRNPLPSPPLLCRESSGGLREETSGRCWLSLVTVSTAWITVTPTASSHLGQDLSWLVLLLQDAYFFPWLLHSIYVSESISTFWPKLSVETLAGCERRLGKLTPLPCHLLQNVSIVHSLMYFQNFARRHFVICIVKVWHSFRFIPGCSIFKWHLKTML